MRAPAISAECGGLVAMTTPAGRCRAISSALRVAARAQKYSMPTGASRRRKIALTIFFHGPVDWPRGPCATTVDSIPAATRCTVPNIGSEWSSRPCGDSRTSLVITCTSNPWRVNSRVRKLKRLAPTSGLGAKW
jgi:hypothetical protein